MGCRLVAFGSALVLAGACDRVESQTTPDAATDISPAAHEPLSTDELRELHVFAADDEGVPCADDRGCASPLRCIDATCLWPAAMTGAIGDDTPYVEFTGTNLETARYYLEVADEAHELARGLMHRHEMVDDMGMIFMFDQDAPRSFWMRNTFIPLDMIFVTSEGVVDSFVEDAEPRTDTPRRSAGDARYVIELDAGEVARIGLRAGSVARIVGLSAAATD